MSSQRPIEACNTFVCLVGLLLVKLFGYCLVGCLSHFQTNGSFYWLLFNFCCFFLLVCMFLINANTNSLWLTI